MTFIDSLVSYLQTNNIGTPAQNMFIGEFPEDAKNSIALMLSPSPEPDKSVAVYQQVVDVLARYSAGASLAGQEKLLSIFNLLHKRQNYAITDYHVYLSYAAGMIDDLGRTVNDQRLYRLTLVFTYREDE